MADYEDASELVFLASNRIFLASNRIDDPAEVQAALESATRDLVGLGRSLSNLAEWHYESQHLVEDDNRLVVERAGKYLEYASDLAGKASEHVDLALELSRRIVWQPQSLDALEQSYNDSTRSVRVLMEAAVVGHGLREVSAISKMNEARDALSELGRATNDVAAIDSPADVDAALKLVTVGTAGLGEWLDYLGAWHLGTNAEDATGSREAGRLDAQRASNYLYHASYLLSPEAASEMVDIAQNFRRDIRMVPERPDARSARRLAPPSQFGTGNHQRPDDGLGR